MFFVQHQMWQRLGKQPLDLLVIGGGINGAGVAREASRRGLSVALIEQNDLASGTSSRSSKLVHGGLRYLEQAELHLVFESVSERRVLLETAPHLVAPLGFLFPIYSESRISLPVMTAGIWMYEALAKFDSPNPPMRLSVENVHKVQPALSTEHMTGSSLYFDAATDDARLTLETAIDAAEHGAIIATWVKCVGFIKDEDGKVIGLNVQNQLTGERKNLFASVVVNTSGPWMDQVLGLDSGHPPQLLRPTKGVHIAVSALRLPIRYAVLCLHPVDQRVMFVIPWGDHAYVGTTDTDYHGDPAEVAADAWDVEYLLQALEAYFPSCKITADDIVSTWAGLRPLMKPQSSDGHAVDESSVSREHQVVVSKSGIVSLAGGKLTTYRLMAIDAVDKVVELLERHGRDVSRLQPSDTRHALLPGAVNWPSKNLPKDAQDAHEVAHHRLMQEVVRASGGLVSDWTADALVRYYGTRAIKVAHFVYADPTMNLPICHGRPEIIGQIGYAVAYEFCATISDFMMQRTQLYFRTPDQGVSGLKVVADEMQRLLNWSDTVREEMLSDYMNAVKRGSQWRLSASDEFPQTQLEQS